MKNLKFKAYVKSLKTTWDVVNISWIDGKIDEIALDFEGNEGDVFVYGPDEVDLIIN